VPDDCIRHEADRHSGAERASAEVGILEVHEETLVEAAQLFVG
jgi:hypothetical protein